MTATYSILRRLDSESVPTEIATGLTEKSYSDNTALIGVSYNYSVSVTKNGVTKVSTEAYLPEYAEVFMPLLSNTENKGSIPLITSSSNLSFSDGFAVLNNSSVYSNNTYNFLAFETGDFFIEFTVKNITTAGTLFDFRNPSANKWDNGVFLGPTAVTWSNGVVGRQVNYNFSQDAEAHCCITRKNDVLYILINDVVMLSVVETTNISTARNFRIGSNYIGAEMVNGFVKNIRIRKGVSRYV